jgi:transcriptional regulator with XRE-family HTH domain
MNIVACRETEMTKLRAARKALGLTVYDVAAQAHLAPSTVSKVERGLVGISPEPAKRLAAVLGIEPADVIFVERAPRAKRRDVQ